MKQNTKWMVSFEMLGHAIILVLGKHLVLNHRLMCWSTLMLVMAKSLDN